MKMIIIRLNLNSNPLFFTLPIAQLNLLICNLLYTNCQNLHQTHCNCFVFWGVHLRRVGIEQMTSYKLSLAAKLQGLWQRHCIFDNNYNYTKITNSLSYSTNCVTEVEVSCSKTHPHKLIQEVRNQIQNLKVVTGLQHTVKQLLHTNTSALNSS